MLFCFLKVYPLLVWCVFSLSILSFYHWNQFRSGLYLQLLTASRFLIWFLIRMVWSHNYLYYIEDCISVTNRTISSYIVTCVCELQISNGSDLQLIQRDELPTMGPFSPWSLIFAFQQSQQPSEAEDSFLKSSNHSEKHLLCCKKPVMQVK